MSSVLKKLEERMEKKMEERMGPLASKMDEMIKILRQIEENTRG
ncbi:MAG: hypothetical protein ACETVR_00400 [Candidatus Bathyarchaeia archaeon]